MKALQYPKWEDYEYEYADSEDNSLYWLGDGQSWDEKNENGDRASTLPFLHPLQEVDSYVCSCRGVVPERGVCR